MHNRHRRPGFTLIELLVVIAIIGVLVGLLLPAVQAAREAARRMNCQSNMKQIALGVHNYESTYKTAPLTYAGGGSPWGDPPAATLRSTSWLTQILPFIEQDNLFDMIDFSYDVSLDPRNGPDVNNPLQPSNLFVARTAVPTFLCPSDGINDDGRMNNRANRTAGGKSLAVNNYKGVAGANWAWGTFATPDGSVYANTPFGVTKNGLDRGNGMFFRASGFKSSTKFSAVTDGMSNTLMIGEAVPRWCTHTWWFWFNGSTATAAVPLNAKAVCRDTGNRTADLDACWGDWPHNYSFMSRHAGGANFALADGSVRFVSETINYDVYRGSATMANGEAVSLGE